MRSLLKQRWWGVQVYEWVFIGLFYFGFAYLYHLTLWINRLYEDPPLSDLYRLVPFLRSAGLDYLIKLLLTLPIWWLIFRRLKHWHLQQRLAVHLITLPLYVLAFWKIYHGLSDWFGWGRLRSYAQIWDIYIPALFYFIQFGILHAYEYYHDNQRNLKLKAALSEAALKSELAALKAQLNPHFLYNVFNTISASVPPQQETTRELIAKLSDLFRYQLKASQSEWVPLREELTFVRKYLDLEQARFEDRLEVTIDVPEELLDTPVPPMIIQPLVENSIKHGISSSIKGGEVLIRVNRQEDGIHFIIADTGIGVKDKEKLYNTGVGLTNTKLRLEKLCGSQLLISDNEPSGLKIEFAI